MSSSTETEVSELGLQPVLIELNGNLKVKLVNDLSCICEVSESEARMMLEKNKWNIQRAIDAILESNQSSDEDEVVILSPQRETKVIEEVVLTDSPIAAGASSSNYSRIAPETLSVLSWNLDGLDEKILEKRTDAVISLVEKENHDVLFFQELTPITFDFIARKLESKYTPILGTRNPKTDYFVATFLRHNKVYHDDDYIIPFGNSSMDRKLLVVKAFIGRAKLFLLNTHLESTAEFANKRTAQLKICFDHCVSFPPEYNVIFGGDLNLRDKEVEGVIPVGLSDLWIKCGSRDTAKYTWDLTRNTNKQMPSKFQPRCRFDRLYYRESNTKSLTPEFFGLTGIEKVEGTQSFPSDHWAIISFFRLSAEARLPQSSFCDEKTENLIVL